MSGAERHKDKCVFYPFIYLHLFDVHGIGGYFALVLMFFFCFFSWNIHQGCLHDYLKQKKTLEMFLGLPSILFTYIRVSSGSSRCTEGRLLG